MPGVFNSTGEYLALDEIGIFRLREQQKLFDIIHSVRSFAADDSYLNVGHVSLDDEVGIYSMRDGRYYAGLQVLHLSAGVLAIGSDILVIEYE